VHVIKYCKIVRNVVKEAKKQHYSRRIGKSNTKIKTTMNNIKKETGKVHSVEQVPTLLVNDEKLKDPTYVANAFNSFFTTVT
jgi:tRNA uridine 5-carbamoylmethylation protein Kti12